MAVARMLPELIRSLFQRPATIRYPLERVPAPKGLRGKPVCDYSLCIGCRMCSRDCPAAAIEMTDTGERTPRPVFHYDRCAFCGQCADTCPKKAISLTSDYELSAFSKDDLVSLERRHGESAAE